MSYCSGVSRRRHSSSVWVTGYCLLAMRSTSCVRLALNRFRISHAIKLAQIALTYLRRLVRAATRLSGGFAAMAERGDDFLVVLAERGRRRVDARAAMRKGEGGERHAETTLDAGHGG